MVTAHCTNHCYWTNRIEHVIIHTSMQSISWLTKSHFTFTKHCHHHHHHHHRHHLNFFILNAENSNEIKIKIIKQATFTPDTCSQIQVSQTSNLYPSTGWWIQVLSSVLLADTSGYMSPWRQFCRRYGIQTATRDASGLNLYPGYMYQV